MPTLVAADPLVDELMRTEGKAEIIDGRIVKFMATGDEPSYASGKIFVSLFKFVEETGEGRAVQDNAGFLCNLPNRRSFSPDAAFYTGPGGGRNFFPQPPVFAVEVRSENDYGNRAERAIAQKIRDYFDAGTLVVWDVDLYHGPIVTKYSASNSQNPTYFERGDFADAEPAVRGWKMPVDSLFPTQR